ncbi:uncharacterized protein LOC143615407 [Bidens hawaiensis]|uniref:uncharacterized protein LOC143615407 n=1 Tax=Bidens hawaiensis TaxID=980011 RepID=UPI00404A2273
MVAQPVYPAQAYQVQAYQPPVPQIMANQVVKPVQANQASTSQAAPTVLNAHGRAFMINANQAQHNNDVVNGTFLVNNVYASILFDTGADMSFVSFDFEPMLSSSRSKPENSFTVEVANGKTISINSVIRGCTLNLNDYDFSIDLIPMKFESFDIIVGMDWLAQNRAKIVYFEKYIRIPLDDDRILRIFGEKRSKGLKLMSCTQAQKYLRKKYVAFLANVVEKKPEKKTIKDILVVRNFPEVFPNDVSGLPPTDEVEFCIDLVPDANPVAKAPYRLAPMEMQELVSQLQELSSKGVHSPKFVTLGSTCSFR